MRKKQLIEEFQVSRAFVDEKIRGMQSEIEKGRYSPYVILDTMINVYAFMDYIKYGKLLKDKNARKYVPDFKPSELMELCGYQQKIAQIE